MNRYFLAVFLASVASAAPAGAAQICGWLVESNEPEDVRGLTLWLQSDADVDFLYAIGGKGIVNGMGYANSPAKASYTLHAGHAEAPWHGGGTLDAPAKIDITVELHQTPADIFSDAPTPLLAKFAFARNVPASEKKPPATLAKKQCAIVAVPGH
ncbi:MAG: hypothetical protein ABSD74_16720 [Rhizomicrobium sp.]